MTHIIALDGYSKIAPDLAVARQAKCRQEAKNGMANLVPSARLVNVPHDIVIEEGALWAAIHRLIEKHGGNLVVGSKEWERTKSSARFERRADVPAICRFSVDGWTGCALRTAVCGAFKHILSATDFGPGAEKEAGFALSLAKEHRSRKMVLHVSTRTKQMADLERESILRQMSEPVPDNHVEHCLVDFRGALGNPRDETGRFHLLCARELLMDVRSSRWRPGPR